MITYLIKLILCSGLFLLVYSLFLEKEKMHKFNRFYLLASLILAFAIPLITFTIHSEAPLQIANEVVMLPNDDASAIAPSINIQTEKTPINFQETAIIIYWLISAFFLALFLVHLVRIWFTIRNKKYIPYRSSSRLILTEENVTPHSFLSYIFLQRTAYESGTIEKEILCHEMIHVQQYHSLDILFIEMLSVFFWFNPFMFLYKRAIKLNHEFLADDGVINEFQNTTAYQYLLVEKTNQSPALSFTSQFNFLITKKRLTMITKNTSRRIALLKKSLVFAVVVAAIFAFSLKEIVAQNSASEIIINDAIPDTTKPSSIGLPVFSIQEGVSQKLMNEYQQIINRNKKPINGWFINFRKGISKTDRNRMKQIFMRMSQAQQNEQTVFFTKPPGLLPRVVPSEKQFESFKNAQVYGVWINEKRVSNSALDKYAANDFAQLFVSKLYGAAKKGRIYSYQVNLMTKDYYQDYRDNTRPDSSSLMLYRFAKPKVVTDIEPVTNPAN